MQQGRLVSAMTSSTATQMGALHVTTHVGTVQVLPQLVVCPAIQTQSWKVTRQTTECAVMATTQAAQSTTASRVIRSV
jgi:hypothetical protein